MYLFKIIAFGKSRIQKNIDNEFLQTLFLFFFFFLFFFV